MGRQKYNPGFIYNIKYAYKFICFSIITIICINFHINISLATIKNIISKLYKIVKYYLIYIKEVIK